MADAGFANGGHRKRPVMQASQSESGFGARHRRSFLLAFGIGVVMAIIAPLQTDEIAFLPRAAYWQILMLSGAVIGLGITELVERWGRLRSLPWLEVPLIGVLIALPLTLIVMSTSMLFFGANMTGIVRFSYNFGVTALISVAITALGHMINSGREPVVRTIAPSVVTPMTEAISAQPAAEKDNSHRFAARLPIEFRHQPITALQAEDHYLRVHFAGGQSTLILMRLSDAIAELPAHIGAQTHRSWWVAKDAVRSVTKADGRATLLLDNAVEAPVSRSYYKALAAGNWLIGA